MFEVLSQTPLSINPLLHGVFSILCSFYNNLFRFYQVFIYNDHSCETVAFLQCLTTLGLQKPDAQKRQIQLYDPLETFYVKIIV